MSTVATSPKAVHFMQTDRWTHEKTTGCPSNDFSTPKETSTLYKNYELYKQNQNTG